MRKETMAILQLTLSNYNEIALKFYM